MTNEQKLIDKCNLMALIIGELLMALIMQYEKAPNKALEERLVVYKETIEKVFDGIEHD